MDVDPEIARRTEAALSAISAAFGTEGDEYGVTLFVNHHIEEIEEDYWRSHLSTGSPEPHDVIKMLILKKHWSAYDDDDEVGLNFFDFTLPGDITNYVICVGFDENGEVASIEMES